MRHSDLYKKNMESEIFCVPVMVENFRYILREKLSTIREYAYEIYRKSSSHILLLGSGASLCALHPSKYLLDKRSELNAELVTGPEFLNRKFIRMTDKNTFAIIASYTGLTKDTLGAVDLLLERKIPYLAITRSMNNELAHRSKMILTYDSKALYTAVVFELYLLLTSLLRDRGEFEEGDTFLDDLKALPELVEETGAAAESLGKSLAKALVDEEPIYVIADGIEWGLGYQLAYTMIMEYLKREAAFIRSCEFRHGPMEVIDEGKPTLIFILGNDESRAHTESAFEFSKHYGAKVHRVDVREIANVQPLLSPIILYPVIQWMILQMATDSGLYLDEYRYMHKVPYRDSLY